MSGHKPNQKNSLGGKNKITQTFGREEMSKDFMEEAALKLRLEKYLGLGVFETSLFAFYSK